MNNKEIMDYAEEAIIHTYNRFPVVLDHGDGVYLYDVEGKKYLDFAAGIAVCAFGYNVKEYNDALKAQIDKMIHVSNLYYTQPMAEAAHRIPVLWQRSGYPVLHRSNHKQTSCLYGPYRTESHQESTECPFHHRACAHPG